MIQTRQLWPSKTIMTAIFACFMAISITGYGQTWTQLSYDDFETGFGNWTSGGSDCYWYEYSGDPEDQNYAPAGIGAVVIQDNDEDVSTCFSMIYDVTGYQQIRLQFTYFPYGLEPDESFTVEYYDGSTWNIIAEYVSSQDFINENIYQEELIIDAVNYNFPSNMQLKFVCDASSPLDKVAIDEVYVSVNGPVSTVPVAVCPAQSNITLPTNSVVLDGSSSTGDIDTYTWTQLSGPAATLSGENTAVLSATGLQVGSYTFQLTVSGIEGSDVCQTSFSVNPVPPPVAVCPSQSNITLPTNSVVLNGSASTGDISTYTWSQLSGPVATLSGQNTAILSASNLQAGSYTFQLAVSGASGSDNCQTSFTVNSTPPPTSNAWLLNGNSASGSDYLGTTNSQALSIRTNGTERIKVASTGNVGIGIASPTEKLDVNGSLKIRGSRTYIDGFDGTNYHWIRTGGVAEPASAGIGFVRTSSSDNTLTEIKIAPQGGDGSTFLPGGKMYMNGATEDKISLYDNRLGSSSMYGFGVESGTMYFKTNTNYRWYCRSNADGGTSSKMFMNLSGEVGIGTENVTGFKLSVNGKLRASEIQVTNPSTWSDFVFKDDFKLRSLGSVEEFIKTNGHLPDVPSEKEVMENGVNMVEMDATLLQKVEELTLYIIEQNKRLESQQEEINQLKTRLDEKE